jgi:pyruvate dehydrogenase E2 component (dihydrolipoamide acetyltransferase)
VAVSDLLVLAAGRALKAFPEVNVSLVNDEIVCHKSANVGIAVAGNVGLIVPVVRDVQEKSLTDIARKMRDLVERAKEGRLDPAEYSGGTFTISNLGPFGIEDFTAIVNPPEAAILAVSAVIKKPVVVADANGDDAIVIRPMMNIRLSVDHRLIDGLLAAKFVKYFKDLLENLLRILM